MLMARGSAGFGGPIRASLAAWAKLMEAFMGRAHNQSALSVSLSLSLSLSQVFFSLSSNTNYRMSSANDEM
jgi:hypothetical protein